MGRYLRFKTQEPSHCFQNNNISILLPYYNHRCIIQRGKDFLEHTWLSLLPFLIVIGMSIWLKDVLPGLVVGLLVGSIIFTSDLLVGTQQSISYIVTTLSDANNIKIISFLYLFGGLVGMMNIAGGIKGFSEWMGARIKTERG